MKKGVRRLNSMHIIQSPSPNHGSRRGQSIDCIVLHDTVSATAGAALSWFGSSASGVSSHYVIDTDGAIYQCVAESEAAWHSGLSALWGKEAVNDFSIGIELASLGTTPYPETQMDSLVDLVTDLCWRYNIRLNRIVGHRDVAVPAGRKVDPGDHFDWSTCLIRVGAALAEHRHQTNV